LTGAKWRNGEATMTDAARISAEAISALLGGLAEALTDAQQTMAEQPPTDAFGRPLPNYRIPELNFSFEIETVNAGGSGRPWLHLRPTGAATRTGSVSSTISGRIVAVPPNAGLPETRITAVQREGKLDVRLTNNAGEILAGTPLEIEVDSEATNALHGTILAPSARLRLLATQRTLTDGNGAASVKIGQGVLGPDQSAVVLLRAGGAESRISLMREG